MASVVTPRHRLGPPSRAIDLSTMYPVQSVSDLTGSNNPAPPSPASWGRGAPADSRCVNAVAAKAGIQTCAVSRLLLWIPAFAGMTGEYSFSVMNQTPRRRKPQKRARAEAPHTCFWSPDASRSKRKASICHGARLCPGNRDSWVLRPSFTKPPTASRPSRRARVVGRKRGGRAPPARGDRARRPAGDFIGNSTALCGGLTSVWKPGRPFATW